MVLAITELHEKFERAHLDIRLQNICFRSDGTAMLIDLDRSCEKTERAEFLQSQWGESVMYMAPHSDWTAEKIDWRQLAIMILAILNGTDNIKYQQFFIIDFFKFCTMKVSTTGQNNWLSWFLHLRAEITPYL